jgi:hypothetical protein
MCCGFRFESLAIHYISHRNLGLTVPKLGDSGRKDDSDVGLFDYFCALMSSARS